MSNEHWGQGQGRGQGAGPARGQGYEWEVGQAQQPGLVDPLQWRLLGAVVGVIQGLSRVY